MNDSELVERALIACGGRVRTLAEQAGVSSVTVSDWCNRAEGVKKRPLSRFARSRLMGVLGDEGFLASDAAGSLGAARSGRWAETTGP